MLESLMLQVHLFPKQVWQSLRKLGQSILASLTAMLMPVALLMGLAQHSHAESWATLLHPALTKVYEEPPPKSEDRRGRMVESRRDRARLFDLFGVEQPNPSSTLLPDRVVQLQVEAWNYQTLLPNSSAADWLEGLA